MSSPDAVRLCGEWRIEVFAVLPTVAGPYVDLSGTDAMDGAHHLSNTSTPPRTVTGAEWFLSVIWRGSLNLEWHGGGVRQQVVSCTLADGLMVLVAADDPFRPPAPDPPAGEKRRLNPPDVLLKCYSLDPKHTPWRPVTAPLDLSYPRPKRRPGDEGPREPYERDEYSR